MHSVLYILASLCVTHTVESMATPHCAGQQGSNGSAPGHQTEQPQHEDEDDDEEEGTEGQI